MSYPAATVISAAGAIVESAEEVEEDEEIDERSEALEAKVASKAQHDQSPKNVEALAEAKEFLSNNL